MQRGIVLPDRQDQEAGRECVGLIRRVTRRRRWIKGVLASVAFGVGVALLVQQGWGWGSGLTLCLFSGLAVGQALVEG